MKSTILLALSLLLAATTTAQSLEDCANGTTDPISSLEFFNVLEDDQPYVNGDTARYCVESRIFLSIDTAAYIAFTTDGPYPAYMIMTDLTTSTADTLRAFGDSAVVRNNRNYYFEVITVDTGRAQAIISPAIVLPGVIPETVEIIVRAPWPVATTAASALTGITVFPNPASEEINFRGAEIIRSTRLLDLTGREVRRQNAARSAGSLSVAGLRPGVYFLEFTDAKGNRAARRVLIR
jgi:hypothetical protein